MRRGLLLLVVLSGCWREDQVPDGGVGGGGGFGGEGGGFFSEGGGCGSSFNGGTGGGLPETEVIAPATPPPPISGGTLAVLADKTVIAADSDRDEVWILPAASTTATRVALQKGDEPGRVVAGPSGRAFIALRRGGAVAELDVATSQIVARHPACAAPRGLAWSASTLSVACATGELVQLEFANGVPVGTSSLRVADDLRDVVVYGTDLIVTTFRSAQAYRVTPGRQVTLMAALPGRAGFASRVAWRAVPSALGPVMLHQRESTGSLTTCTGYGGFSGEGPVQPAIDVLAGSTDAGVPDVLTFLSVVVDLAVSDDASAVAVASAGSKQVGVINRASGSGTTIFSVGQPVAVAWQGNILVVQSREPAALYLVGTLTTEVRLSSESRKSTGHDLFHVATSRGIACASCHPEAGDDGHVWSLPEGVRRTPTLRGGLKGTLPFHWDGAMTSMEKLVGEIMVNRMGGSPQTPERAAALLEWIDSAPRVPARAVDAAAAARGEALFKDAVVGCAACHAGALGTSNTSVSVGTGATLQVPRLVELAARAPYFHDGRVRTLEERFTSIGGSAHGNTSELSQAQIADLVVYLRSR